MVVPLVVTALALFGLWATTLLQSSKGEYRLTKKAIDRERARLAAQAGLAHGAALIYQNPFTARWYKQQQGPHGYYGVVEGTVGEGLELAGYRVVAEDVANELEEDWKGASPEAKAKRIENLTYNRIDLFSEGSYGDSKVILYQAVILHPEEKVYEADKSESGSTVTYSNVRIR